MANRRHYLAALVVTAIAVAAFPTTGSADSSGCVGVLNGCSASLDAAAQTFHGLIALSDDPSLLDRSAHSGNQPGCGDCTWQLVLACQAGRDDPGNAACAQAADAPDCATDQLAYNLYLSTATVAYEDEGLVCIGGGADIVPVGDDAVAQVEQYLKDVTPPDLQTSFDPRNPIAGFPTRAKAQVPYLLKPQPFGGDGIEDTITIAPKRVLWDWGDGEATAGLRTLHTFTDRGSSTVTVTTTWSATYTLSYAGQTFGPYNAIGTLTRSQREQLQIGSSTPVLVSHG